MHPNSESMLHESLPEMILVAKYCIEYRKDVNIWNAPGCFGYPAALLLLSIVDSIGSYVRGGNVENHFKILNNKEYYNLSLSYEDIKDIRKNYRDLLSHNTLLSPDVGLSIGSAEMPVIDYRENKKWLNLIPFYNLNVLAVKKFLNNSSDILKDNKVLLNISKNQKKDN